ncbi:endo-1,4-beta-xylanase [Methylobacterium gnaphalii]|uniref:Beta-xylanase n=1 Tax=Methylobacterium gnaphalii TaxID=1010610 RepID=A0A512JFT4_9HYPH|nr:endo-1,4-beta-xylanase [Methylobacterium gnaphalii]GEP08817.1 beta-xylanase [Methylobacterium gnaphalii]GJD71574.1 Endo-1,4-beta-xylanase Z [Methylobacterium gnaphalii]GLS47583.1 beta-xylanase [Methylobacterium gnaphalii]
MIPHGPSRRAVLGSGAAAVALSGRAEAAPSPFGPLGNPSWSADGLQAAAAVKGLAFGSAVPITRFRQDRRWRSLAERECGILVCENAMKFSSVVPREGVFDSVAADETLRFARANGQRMRGHCLIWHEGLPPWAEAILASGSASRAETLMRQWIGAMARRYRGTIEAWDVVNEIVVPADHRPGGLRATPWLAALGPGYVDLAFQMLKDEDPGASAVYNENDCEQKADWIDERRSAILRLLEGMLKRGVPINRFGIQAHLTSNLPFDETTLRKFLREIAGMGLAIEITELDIDDRAFPADVAARDRGVADLARRFLETVFDEPAVLNVLAWDLYDPDSWLSIYPARRRPDGLPQRGLPFDAEYRRKPLWHAMHAAFRGAPDHRAARRRLRAKI